MFSLNSYGQDTSLDRKISVQDSILLNHFWTSLTLAIEKKDKYKLATLCEFPFYCRPCIDDTTLKVNDRISIKVTKELFFESQYKEFFDKSLKEEIGKHKHFGADIFQLTLDDKNRPDGFNFSYIIVPPSKTWEGLQGFVYLRKVKGKYKITGIDTVP